MSFVVCKAYSCIHLVKQCLMSINQITVLYNVIRFFTMYTVFQQTPGFKVYIHTRTQTLNFH